MAYLYAQSNHNWSARSSATWNTLANGTGTAQAPVSGDTLDSNGKTVTIDTDLNNGSGLMLNTSLNFSWVYNANVTITSNIGNGAAGGLLLAPVGTPTAFIVGNIAATISNNTPAVNLTGGSLTVTGNVTGGTSGGAVNCGISKSGTAILSVIGNVYGSAGSGINNAGSGLFTLVGNMYPASAALGTRRLPAERH